LLTEYSNLSAAACAAPTTLGDHVPVAHHHQAVQLDGRVGLDRIDERQYGGRIDLLVRRRAPGEVPAHGGQPTR
jgi:hypothetical protein